MAVSNSNNVHKQQIDSSLRSIVFVSGSDINEFDAMLILRPFLTNLILDALDCLEGRMRLHCGYFSQNGTHIRYILRDKDRYITLSAYLVSSVKINK